jgi:hypothetical protein
VVNVLTALLAAQDDPQAARLASLLGLPRVIRLFIDLIQDPSGGLVVIFCIVAAIVCAVIAIRILRRNR